MRLAGDGDDARPPLPLPRIVEDVDGVRRLHDSTMNAREATLKIRKAPTHATLAQTPVLRPVGAVERADSGRRVRGRLLQSPWRRWPKHAAGQKAVLADVGVLIERALVFAVCPL